MGNLCAFHANLLWTQNRFKASSTLKSARSVVVWGGEEIGKARGHAEPVGTVGVFTFSTVISQAYTNVETHQPEHFQYVVCCLSLILP